MTRLDEIVRLTPPCVCIADIGCDHGQLCDKLIEQGKAERAIACDISAPSLKKAEKLARDKKIPIETRCGDGLTVLRAGEAQLAVIAGMGGKEILHILADERRADGISNFVVSPQSEIPALRGGLQNLGLKITREHLIYDRGHYYFIMKIAAGTREYTEDELEFGDLIHAPTVLYRQYLDQKINIIKRKIAEFGEVRTLCEELTKLVRIKEATRREEEL